MSFCVAVDGPNALTYSGSPPINHPPTCPAQTFSVAHDTATAITLSCTDQDAGDTVSYAVHSTPAHGTISPYRGANLTYTPNPGYSGPDQFSFDATDNHGASTFAVVTLNVAPGPNHAPTCAPQTFSVAHDTATAITLSCTDQDAGDA
jgi:hypothetical protein